MREFQQSPPTLAFGLVQLKFRPYSLFNDLNSGTWDKLNIKRHFVLFFAP